MIIMVEIIEFVFIGKLNVTNEATFAVGKNELFRLVLAKFIDSINDELGHWDNVPGSSGYSLARGKAHKLEATLDVATGTKTDGSLCAWRLAIAGGVFFMDLAILAKL